METVEGLVDQLTSEDGWRQLVRLEGLHLIKRTPTLFQQGCEVLRCGPRVLARFLKSQGEGHVCMESYCTCWFFKTQVMRDRRETRCKHIVAFHLAQVALATHSSTLLGVDTQELRDAITVTELTSQEMSQLLRRVLPVSL
ncbi:MAG: hypothetical protein KVP17_005331 [Porospora cf. gigantea B]|uniref:uncharacterized protein n=1 Tax=Porospora cf. gigantea B TaxID=2853592 RepID=UPI0035719B88|nr:MAG: hypothetical protein KVP17_005331 [Porospora cf. gigantea B]